MLRANLARLEEEMRTLAEERVARFAGDAPMLTRAQTARIWGKSAAWVKTMQVAGASPPCRSAPESAYPAPSPSSD